VRSSRRSRDRRRKGWTEKRGLRHAVVPVRDGSQSEQKLAVRAPEEEPAARRVRDAFFVEAGKERETSRDGEDCDVAVPHETRLAVERMMI
jgi:hypothetical protein